MQVYTVTASHGQYDCYCEVDMFTTTGLDKAREVVQQIVHDVRSAMGILNAIGWDASSNCAEPIWELARSAHWDGHVRVVITSMELGKLSSGPEFIEDAFAEAEYTGDQDMEQLMFDLPALTRYEIMARPYEVKYFGEKVH